MTAPIEHMAAAPALAAAVSTALLAALMRFKNVLVDRPNERSLHEKPVPRTGGIAIVIGSLGASAALIPGTRAVVLIAALVALVSLIDDWVKLPAAVRFAAQIAAAVAFVIYGVGPVGAVAAAFLVLTVAWGANLYNFMDGSDGLAGGMAVLGFSCYAVAASLAGDATIAWTSASVACASLPFLLVNFHPAKIFMGDAGSVTLGFLAAALGIAGWSEGLWSPFFPVFVFSPFIADATLTLLRRLLRREAFWRAHREHYYQRLVRMGMGHRNTALLEYAVMLLGGLGGLWTFALGGMEQLALILAWGALLLCAAFAIDLRWSRHAQQGHAS